jgi:hypothetical protein
MGQIKVHINCSPWLEDGKWNLQKEHDYEVCLYSKEDFDRLKVEESMEDALEWGHIHSYHIQYPEDPEPIFE